MQLRKMKALNPLCLFCSEIGKIVYLLSSCSLKLYLYILQLSLLLVCIYNISAIRNLQAVV